MQWMMEVDDDDVASGLPPKRQPVKHYNDRKGIIEAYAKPLIETKFRELKFVKILYTFRKPNDFSGHGMVVLARTRKCSNRERDVYGYDFEMEVGMDSWRAMDKERKAKLVTHELRHMGVDLDEEGLPVKDAHERVSIFLVPHDVVIEVFREEMKEHGVPSHVMPDLLFLNKRAKIKVDTKGVHD